MDGLPAPALRTLCTFGRGGKLSDESTRVSSHPQGTLLRGYPDPPAVPAGCEPAPIMWTRLVPHARCARSSTRPRVSEAAARVGKDQGKGGHTFARPDLADTFFHQDSSRAVAAHYTSHELSPCSTCATVLHPKLSRTTSSCRAAR